MDGPPRGRDQDNSYYGRGGDDRRNWDHDDQRRREPRRGYNVQDFTNRSRREERPRDRDYGGSFDRGYDRSQRKNSNREDYYGDSDRRSSNSRKDEDEYYGGVRGNDRTDDRGARYRGRDDNYYGSTNHRERSRDEGGRKERHRSDSHGGNDSSREFGDVDWRCAQCSTWNYPDERRCNRCGDDKPNRSDTQEKERRRSNSASSNDSRDEFGRDRTQKKKKKVDAEWPPCFQDKTEAFVLDARSGMFYEADSDFFYDPTSKLYYSNKKCAYFSYDADKKRFNPVESSGGDGKATQSDKTRHDTTEQDHLMLVPNGANNCQTSEPPKKGIAIKLTTAIPKQKSEKKRKKRSVSAADALSSGSSVKAAPKPNLSEPTTKVQKQNAANIEKWAVRAGENTPVGDATEKKAKVTSKGKPICWVCKRKFASLEKLQQHEEKSDLHKENLAKQQKEELTKGETKQTTSTDDKGAYVDRAEQRRNMYGPELVLLPVAADMPTKASLPVALEDEDPSPSVNVGHQMLQKLGWKAGAALGRGSEHQKQQQAALAQDWDRIENLAAKNQASRSHHRHS